MYDDLTRFLTEIDFKHIVTLLLGWVIVFVFSTEKYNSPSWAKTSIGQLAPLSPRLLAPGARYRYGLTLYITMVSVIYLGLCFIGPKIAAAFPVAAPLADAQLWPISAASLLLVSGVADDNKLGIVEGFIRRKAHEMAFIPTAVRTLANDLNRFHLDLWFSASRAQVAAVERLSGTKDIEQVRSQPDGKLANWIRANILLHSFTALSGPPYDEITAVDETRDAYRQLMNLHGSIKARLHDGETSPTPDATKAIEEDIDRLLDGSAVLLAATLLQAHPDARELKEVLVGRFFSDIPASPVGRSQYILWVISGLAACALVMWFVLSVYFSAFVQMISHIPGLQSVNLNDAQYEPNQISLTILSGLLIYASTFVVGLLIRDSRLSKVKWQEGLGSYLEFVIWTGLLGAALATALILVAPSVQFSGVSSIIAFNLVIGTLAGIFLITHFRSTARSPATGPLFYIRTFGSGPLAHALAAGLFAVALSNMTQSSIMERMPAEQFAGVRDLFGSIRENMPQKPNEPVEWYRNRFSQSVLREIEQDMKSISDQLGNLKTPADISSTRAKAVHACRLLNDPLETGNKLFAEACTVEERFRETGDQFVRLGLQLESFVESLRGLSAYRTSGTTPKNLEFQVALALGVAFPLAFVFSVFVRFGRAQQLQNRLDRIDESIIMRLHRAAELFLARTNGGKVQEWLIAPMPILGDVTPVEAVRYDKLRSRVFDALKPAPDQNDDMGDSKPGDKPDLALVAGR